MLTYFLKSISYLLHPLFMTLTAAVYFFSATPVQYPPTRVVHWLLSIIIWSLLFPLLLNVVLKKLNAIKSIHLKTVKERFWPLLLNSIIMSYIGFVVVPKADCVELHYFVLGSLLTISAGIDFVRSQNQSQYSYDGCERCFYVYDPNKLALWGSNRQPRNLFYFSDGCHGELKTPFKCTHWKGTDNRLNHWHFSADSTFGTVAIEGKR